MNSYGVGGERDGRDRPDKLWGRPEATVVNLARLAVFCKVVEQRSFSKAADELFVTQPTVSQHIRALEQVFGTELLDRRRRDVQLTEAGEIVYDFAVTMRQAADALSTSLSDLTGGLGGTVSIGAGGVPNVYILSDLVARFYQEFPTARIRLHNLAPQDVVPEVLHGRIDMGVASEISVMPQELKAEPLWTESTVLVAPPGHPLASRETVTMEDLADEPFIAGPSVSAGVRGLDASFRRAGLPPRRIVLELGTQDGVKQAALRGVGLAVLFERVAAAALSSGELVRLPVPDAVVTEQFLLVYRHTHRFSRLAKNLVAFLRADVDESVAAEATPPRTMDVTDAQWAVIEPVLSPRGRRGRRRTDDRRLFNGVLWVEASGGRWADLPSRYGTPAKCQERLRLWQDAGVWTPAHEAWTSAPVSS